MRLLNPTERKQAEEALRASEEKLRAQYKGIPVPTYTWQRVGEEFVLADYNDAAEEITRGNVAGFVGRTASEMYRDRPDILEELSQCFAEKRSIKREMEYRFSTTGENKHLAVSYVFVPPDLVMVHTEEITERKRMEEALRESERRYSELVQQAPDAIVAVDRLGNVESINPAAEQLSGYDAKELIGKNFAEIGIVMPQILPKVLEEFELVMAGEERPPSEWDIVRKDKSHLTVELNTRPIRREEKVSGVQIIARDITERKRAEEARRGSEERLRTVVTGAPIVLWALDRDGVFTFSDGKGLNALGLKPGEVVGRSVFDVYRDVPQILEYNRRALAGEEFTSIVEVAGLWFESWYSPLRDQNGEVSGVIGVAIDITERKRAEEALRKSEERYKKQFEEAMDAIFIADAETGIIVDCNRVASELVGREKSELVGKHQRILHPPEETQGEFSRTFKQHLKEKEGQVLEAQVITKEGKIKDVAIKASTFELEGKKMMLGIFRDITEGKQAEEALRGSEERFRLLVEHSTDAFFLHDFDGRILDVNRHACESLGYTREELLGLSIQDIEQEFVSGEHLEKWKQMVPGEPITLEGAQKRKDGTTFPVEVRLGVFESGERQLMLGLVRDITERRRAEEALWRSEERLSVFTDLAPDAFALFDSELNLVEVNKVGLGMLPAGTKKEEVIGKDVTELYPDIKKTGRYGKYLEVMKTGKPLFVDDVVPHPEFGDVHLAVRAFKVGDGLGMIVTDITERKRAEEALRESEERYRSVVEYSRAGILIVDDAYRFIYVNDELCRILGYSREEIVGQDFRRFLDDESKQLVADRYIRRQRGEEVPSRYEFNIVRKDGEKRHVELSSTVINDSAGKVKTVAQILDITVRKRAEEEIRQRSEELATLNAIAMTVTGTLDLQEVLQAVQERVTKLIGEEYPPIFTLFNEGDQTFRVMLTRVHEQPLRRAERLLKIRFEKLSFSLAALKPALREALLAGKPYVTDDGSDLLGPGTSRRLIKGAQRIMGVKWIVDLPLWAKGKLVGTMVLLSQKESMPDEEMELLSAIANQVAIAIENARLYEEAQRRIGELSGLHEISQAFSAMTGVRETFGELTKRMAQLIGCDICVIGTYDHRTREMQAHPPGYGAADELIRSFHYKVDAPGARDAWNFRLQGPLLANDIAQIPEFFSQWVEGFDLFNLLIVPMTIEGSIIGLVYAANKPDGFAEDDSKLLTIFASRAAIAIENARLYEEERRRSLQRKTIAEVGRTIAAILDVDTLLSRVVDLIAQNFGYYIVHVFEVDADTGYAVFKASTGEADRLLKEEGFRLRIGEEGVIGWVAQSGQPLMANDVNKEPRYYFHPVTAGTRSELAVPIRLGEKIIGVLDVQSEELDAFDESDLATLETLADQLAVVIENARLFEGERRKATQLAVINEVGRKAISILDLHEMLEEVARSICSGFNYYNVSLFLVDKERHEAIMEAVTGGFEHIAPGGYRQSLDKGIIGLVIRTGRSWLANDVSQDPYYIKGFLEEPLTKSELCVPIKLGGDVIGALDIQSVHLNAFDETDVMGMETLSGQIAIAIENARLYEETKRLAATDPLTGVWNRRHIQERLGIEVARARRFGHELSVLVMDIDKLKLFNDTYGHPAGDKVIRTVAEAVLTSCREVDVVGRYGGDEFAVILPEAGAQGATMVAGRILAALKRESFAALDGTKVPIRVSIGAASYPSDSDEADRLFSLADAAMYRVKVAGGGQFASLMVGPEGVPEELTAPFDVLLGLLIAVDTKDRYTFKHSQEVTERALALAQKVGLSEEEMRALEIAGKLHDIGKIGIPTNVLRKPGALTPEEWRMIREHPHLGYLILQQLPQMEVILDAVLHHHERWDGKGYPDEMEGEQIPKLARMLAIADAYSAMLTDRPYRKALSEEEALQEIQNCAGTQFDPELAELFVDLLRSGK